MFDTGSSKSDLPDIHSRDKRMASAVGHGRQENTTQRKSTRSSSTSATPSSLSAARAVDSEKRDSAVHSSMQ